MSNLGWIDGWLRDGQSKGVAVWAWTDGHWRESWWPADRLFFGRMLEPSLAPFRRLSTRNVGFTCRDLSRASRLLEARDLLRHLVPRAGDGRHAIVELQSEPEPVYVPMALLIRELWSWSANSSDYLFLPGGLDLLVTQAEPQAGEIECFASSALVPYVPTDTALRRAVWLSTCTDARDSWNSVLTNEMKGRIDMALPRASLSGHAWGVSVANGILACELTGVRLDFDLPSQVKWIRCGSRRLLCPPPPQHRTGMLRF